MNILLIGNGAREQAIAEALLKSKHKPKLYSYMKANNPGITALSEGVELGEYADVDAIAGFAQHIKADFAFIGPEDPLNNGVVDSLEQIGVPAIGPKKVLAQLETSKTFTRDLLKKYNITGNPVFSSFTKDTISNAENFVEKLDEIVVKPDGLTGGKGVRVQGDHFKDKKEGIVYAQEVLSTHPTVIIEEKLEGEEFSLQCLSDGTTVVAMPPVQDHKRAFDGDSGPNTGGMGSYSCENHLLPFLKKEDIDEATKITQQVCDAIHKETGEKYIGVMYGGFMVTKNGVRLIEYNARFGDPEAMNVLPILETDFVEVCQQMIKENLSPLKFSSKATVCKYIVPEGYPTDPVKGEKIQVEELGDAQYFYAAVDQRKDGLYMSTSRALGCVGIADTVSQAEQKAEHACNSVSGKVFHRKDIGTKELLQKRVDHMKQLMNE